MLAAALACGKFGPGDLSRTIAIEVTAPDSLEEYDTITPHARLLDGRGDPVAATIAWSLPDSADTVALTLIDPTTGRITVNHTGLTGRLLARSGGFVGNPVSIRTLAAADTLFAASLSTVDTVALPADSVSDSLKVEVADTIESASGGGSLTVTVVTLGVILGAGLLPHLGLAFAVGAVAFGAFLVPVFLCGRGEYRAGSQRDESQRPTFDQGFHNVSFFSGGSMSAGIFPQTPHP